MSIQISLQINFHRIKNPICFEQALQKFKQTISTKQFCWLLSASSCTDGKLAHVDIKINYLMPSAVFKIFY